MMKLQMRNKWRRHCGVAALAALGILALLAWHAPANAADDASADDMHTRVAVQIVP